jgi:hypothetical protein
MTSKYCISQYWIHYKSWMFGMFIFIKPSRSFQFQGVVWWIDFLLLQLKN